MSFIDMREQICRAIQCKTRNYLAPPVEERLRISLPGILGIFSSVLLFFSSRLGAILSPIWGATSPHLQCKQV